MCHLPPGESPEAPGIAHVTRWEAAPQAVADVGCADCHGGDAAAADAATAATAHAGVLPADDLRSPVHPAAVPATCGACHETQLEGHRTSPDAELLAQANMRGPICTTCHGSADRRVVPATVATTCGRCHQSETAGRVFTGVADARRRAGALLEYLISAPLR